MTRRPVDLTVLPADLQAVYGGKVDHADPLGGDHHHADTREITRSQQIPPRKP